MRHRTKAFVVTTALLFAVNNILDSTNSAAATERPNIILIMTDDQGWGDLGCHGNPVLETPHIDALAQGSGKIERFYVSPVCTPTRACLMTGRYNYRTRAIDTYKGRAMMEPDEVTVAELLKNGGYSTGIFGKWHLGDCYPMRPQDQGFDMAVVHRGGGIGQPSDPIENKRRYTNPILFRNGRQFQAEGYCTDVYFDEALQFIERESKRGEPFFAYIATNAPHGPFHDMPDDLYQKYKSLDLSPVLLDNGRRADVVARVFAMVENIDQNVGRLTQRLDELELADDTVVIFMCDNGPNSQRYVGSMRGMKSNVHEGGIRSPFIVRWPGKVSADLSVDRIAAHIDLLPTLLDIAGAAPPTDLRLDGRSLLPLLLGRTVDWPDRALVLQTHRGDSPVAEHHFAVVEQRWKLLRPSGFGKEQPPADAPFELYDLQADPGEANNLAGQRPAEVARLRKLYNDWFSNVSSTRPDNYAPPRIVIGTDHEPVTTLTRQNWRSGDPEWNSADWGNIGRWMVSVPQQTVFDVRVIMSETTAGEAELAIGSVVVKQKVDEPRSEYHFSNVTVPVGEAAVTYRIRDGDKVSSAYHVVLSRK